MFLIISRLKDKKSKDAKIRKFLTKFLMKSVLFCYYEKFWKAVLLEELINLEDIKLEENVSLHIILLL